MDIQFSCDGCGQHLVIDEAGAGLLVQCPACGRDLTVPNPTAHPTPDAQQEKERTVALRWTPPSGGASNK